MCTCPWMCLSLDTIVCLCVCVNTAVLSSSCLMFYALLSESDDTAADSPLSQQPLISIALRFNLLSSSVCTPLSPSLPLLCLLSPNSRSFFFLLQNFNVLGSFYSFFFPPTAFGWDVPLTHIKAFSHLSLCCCFSSSRHQGRQGVTSKCAIIC